MDRPACVKDKHLEYLDRLRESGVTNMMNAYLYLEVEFGGHLCHDDAVEIQKYWIKTFGKRRKRCQKK